VRMRKLVAAVALVTATSFAPPDTAGDAAPLQRPPAVTNEVPLVRVPRVVGVKWQTGAIRLSEIGLWTGNIRTAQRSHSVAAAVVVKQLPAAGTLAPRWSRVDLVVVGC
jgi:hypothetical protein